MKQSDPYGSSWYSATMVAHPTRDRLNFDLDVDVCVVGGGLAGLTVAREVARRGWSVIVLESRRIAWNASGRNMGFVLPGFAETPEAIISRAGIDAAKELWTLSEGGVEYVRRTIAETGMPGVDPADGWLTVSKTHRPKGISRETDLLRDTFNADVEFWPADLVRSKLKSRHYFQAVHYPTAFHLHPLNYALGLAKAAEDAGARIFEDSKVFSIDPAGVRKRASTANARVRAAHIVLAGNVHLGNLLPNISQTLLPISTYVMTTEPLGDRLRNVIDYPGAVSDTEWADNHYRITPDGRLMWSGRMTMWSGNPRRYAKRLRADIRRVYPQLGKVEISHSWTGVLGKTIHRMPQVGEVSPGVWLASGFSGHGLNTTAMAGEMIARGIVDGDRSWRLFLPYELIWAGGTTGKIALQVAYWAQRISDAAAAKRSRRDEKQNRRRTAKDERNTEARVKRATTDAVQLRAQKEAQAAADALKKAPAES